MRNNAKGFTLIELVVVIIILGILAATALPKFIDLSGDAKTAAAAGIAGGISSGSSVNYAARKASNGTKGVAYLHAAPCTKANLDTLMQQALPTDYTYAAVGTPDCTGADGTNFQCTVTPAGGGTAATATGICVN